MRKWQLYMNFSLIKEYKGYVLFATLVLGGIFTIENINDRFWLNDFKVYYLAAKNLLAGDAVYGVVLGLDTGFYKYSPSILLAFVPFTLFNYYAASVIHYVVIAIATVLGTLLVQRSLNRYVLSTQNQPSSYILPTAFVCVLNHLFRELHLGNVNMIIVCLLIAALYFIMNRKDNRAGLLLGIVVLIKPYLLLLSLPLLLHKRFKSLLSQAITILLSFVGVTLFFGFTKSLELHNNWVRAVLYHSEYLTSQHTLVALIRKYLYSGMTDSFQFYVLVFFTITYVLVFYFFVRPRLRNNAANEGRFLFLAYFSLLAIIPSILITDTEHFLFSLPLLLFAFNQLSSLQSAFLKSAFVLLVLMYGTAGGGIFGSDINEKFEEMGLLGIANLGIILFVLFIFSKDLYKNAPQISTSA